MNRLVAAMVIWGSLLACSSKKSEPAAPSSSCSPPSTGFDLATAEAKYSKLSDVCLFDLKGTTLVPKEGLLPYDLRSPLFSDYTLKQRFVWMPKGTSAKYQSDAAFDFPVGTIIVKTFATAPDLRAPDKDVKRIETRLMIKNATGWIGLPYVWNAGQTEATLRTDGAFVDLAWTHTDGSKKSTTYLVPNALQCRKCHDDDTKTLGVIGPRARHLNRELTYADGTENQLTRWTKVGYLTGAPAPDTAPKLAVWDDTKASLDDRARAWLEINCAHCHDARGTARTSGLLLMASEKDLYKVGVCKKPIAAGRGSGGLSFDIVPGKPDQSIFVYRMESNEPDVMMPELSRSIVHREGVDLIREWITAMPGSCASP